MQARFLAKEPGLFCLAANGAGEHKFKKPFRRRFSPISADVGFALLESFIRAARPRILRMNTHFKKITARRGSTEKARSDQ
jgi:hypothetical protein